MNKEELIRLIIISYIIGFIIALIIGIFTAIISYYADFPFLIVISGGIPLSWLNYSLGIVFIDYFALILDIILWTFIVYLILTGKKIEKVVKKKKKKLSCMSCNQKITFFQQYNEMDDGTILCNDCFEKYEQGVKFKNLPKDNEN